MVRAPWKTPDQPFKASEDQQVNSTTRALNGATARPAKRTPEETAAEWMRTLRDNGSRVMTILSDLHESAEAIDASTALYRDADVRLGSLMESFGAQPLTNLTAEHWCKWVMDLELSLQAAVAAEDGTSARIAQAKEALGMLTTMRLTLQDGRLFPKEREEQFRARNWTRGKDVLCDLMDAIAKQPEELLFLEREYLPEGVVIDLGPAQHALELIDAHPEYREGFAHALTGLIATGLPASNITPYGPEELRRVKPEDCIGPGTFRPDSPQFTTVPIPWRHIVLDLLDELCALLDAACSLDICEGNNAYANTVVRGAIDLLNEHEDLLHRGTADDYYGSCFTRVEAELMAVRDMRELSAAMKGTLSVAYDKASEISKVLDGADLVPPSPPSPGSAEEDPNFMEGLRLFADTHAQACRIRNAGSDKADLYARNRGRGVPQNNFAKSFLQQVVRRPDLLEGFAAGMCHALSITADNGVTDELRELSWEDYVGGPDTKYITEESGPNADEHPQQPVSTKPVDEERIAASDSSDFPCPDRIEVARRAATFAAKLVDHFQVSTEPGTPGDLAALAGAASVIISALTDPVEPVDSIQVRLQAARELASVIQVAQPQATWVVQPEHVGKRLIVAVH